MIPSKYEIISNFLFPKFTHPKESRFLNFFYFINKKKKNNNFNNFTIYYEKIENGDDKRTTVIMKNIPHYITKENFCNILEGIGNINYLYLPYNKITNENLGFAFINVVNYKNIINLCNRLLKYKFDKMEIGKSIQINYYRVQGRTNLSNMLSKNK
jgi:RNA recognition motif-containing protein